MTEEDQVFINNRLPELVEIGSKRSKQGEKKRHEKIKKLKAGNTLIHARSSLNKTRLVNGMANSANELVHMLAQETSVDISQARPWRKFRVD